MKKFIPIILPFLAAIIITACNTEEGLEPASQNSYIKIIQGLGSDNPLKIEALDDGTLLIVSNSLIRGQGENVEKIRVLKVNINGTVLDEKYFPENINQNWIARDMIVLPDNKITIGGALRNENREDTSLVVFTIDANNLDSIASQTYNSDAETYNMSGLSYDQNSSKILFGGSEIRSGNVEFTVYGEMNANDLSDLQTFKSDKVRALPATAFYKDNNGVLSWAYNSETSTLSRSNDRRLNVIDESEDLDFENAENIRTKKLIVTEEGEILLFGETNEPNEPTKIFYYKVFSGNNEVVFGEPGNNTLNGAKRIDGGYLITGSTEILVQGANVQTDFLLSRRTENGGEAFTESFGSDANEQLHDATMVGNNIYSIGSTTLGIENTLLLIKTDKFGRLRN
jgi:hypothetical protein